MNRSYRNPFLTIFLFVSVFAIGLNSLEVFGQSKRGSATKAALAGPADVLLTENFDYTAGSLLTANGWTAHDAGGATPNAITITSGGLTYSGYAGSGIGNSVNTIAPGQDVSRSFSAVTSGSVYAALLVNVATATAAGDYFFHVFPTSTNTFRGRVFVKKDAAGNSFAFGLSRTNGTAVFTPTTTYSFGTTYLVVLKYTYVAGASNDIVQLFVNPTPGSAEPAATLTATDADASEPAQINAVALRQGGSASGSTQQVDGIRVATTWAEAVASGTPAAEPKGQVDLNGDGRTDYLIVRPGQGGAAGATSSNSLAERLRGAKRNRLQRRAAALTDNAVAGASSYQWWGLNSSDFGVFTAEWGEFLDEPLTGDFDGDGKDDITVYRGLPDGSYWYSLDSSTFTLRQVHFGAQYDNPFVVGDYDGDGVDDPATFRCPENAPGICYFFYRKSTAPNSGDWGVGWGQGQGTDVLPFPGDFNGDGLQDFAVQVQSQSNPANGTFWVLLNGSLQYYSVDWGEFNDRLVPGDFDGDGKSDITVTRVDANEILWWYVLEQDGGVRIVPWGNGPDFEAPGDYDGDGADDFAIYRWNATDAAFWVLPSNGSSYYAVTWGQPGDTPLASVSVQ